MILPTHPSVPWMEFQITLKRNAQHSPLGFLEPLIHRIHIPYPATGSVYSENKLSRTAVYLAKTASKEALAVKEQELKDIEVWEIQEAAEQAKATRLSFEKEKWAPKTVKQVKISNLS